MTIILTGSGSIIYCHFEHEPQPSDITLLRDWINTQRGTVTLCGEYAAIVFAELLADKPTNCRLNYRNNNTIPTNKEWQLTINGVNHETC